MDKMPIKPPTRVNKPLDNRAKPMLKTGSIGNNPGFQSKPAVNTLSRAVTYQNQSIHKDIGGNKDRAKVAKLGAKIVVDNAKRAAEAAAKRAKAETMHDKQQVQAGQLHQRSIGYANASRTNPARPANPQNAGSRNQFEEVKPKKYKKAPNYKDKQIMGLNATFGGNNQSQGDTTGVTTNPYESARYNIPFDRADSDDKPIGLDKDLESKDTTKQLKRRKAMKLVKAYVDEEGIGGEGTSGGWGAENAGDPGASASGGQNYTLAKNANSKGYKKAKTFKAMKESLFSEMGFDGISGATDASPNQDEINTGTIGQPLTIDSAISNEKRKAKKKAVKEEIEVSLGTTGKRKKVFSSKVPIRMADGSIKSLPPGKSGSSGH